MSTFSTATISLILGAALGAGAFYTEVLKPEQEKMAAESEAFRTQLNEAKEEAKLAVERARQSAGTAVEKAQQATSSALIDANKKVETLKRQLDEEKKKGEDLAARLAELQAKTGVAPVPAAPSAPVAAAPKADAFSNAPAVPAGPSLDELKRNLASSKMSLDAAQKGRSAWEDEQRRTNARGGAVPDDFSSRRIKELQEQVDNLQFKVDTYGK